MQIFFRNCTQILTRTQGTKFEDMFLVKIPNKGTSLIAHRPQNSFCANLQLAKCV